MSNKGTKKMEIVSKILQELRNEKGLTQQKVADYLKIDRSNYSKYELGKLEISIDMIRKLTKLYSVSADYLLGLEK